MAELHDAIHTIGQVAKATGVSANTIRAWYRRGDLTVGMRDKDSPGATMARKLSGHTALAIGIMGALTSMGVAPGRAQQAALTFAYTGDAGCRDPGHLFPNGATVLVVGPEHVTLLNVDPSVTVEDFRSRAQPHRDGRQRDVMITLWLDEFVDRIRVGLDLGRDPLEAPSA